MMSEEKLPGDFHTLWLKFYDSDTAKHQLFFKEHNVRNQEPDYPRGRTLFVVNVPPHVMPRALKAAFSRSCGNVASVKMLPGFSGRKTGFKIAYVIFSKDSSLDTALSLPRDFTFVLNTEQTPCILGVQKWCKEYNAGVMQNEDKVKEAIEKYMVAYDKKVEKKSAAKEEEIETDGWVTVSGKKKRGQFAPARKESTLVKLQTIEEEKKKKTQLLNFYTFQIRESKKEHLAELRKKFELDKKKLQQLKARRTFKPFG